MPYLKIMITTHFYSGDHIICMDDMYGGTNRYFRKVASKFGLEISFVDETVPANVEKEMRPNTKMVNYVIRYIKSILLNIY